MNFPVNPAFPGQIPQSITYTSIFEPNYLEALKTMFGHSIVVETTRGSLQGVLVDIKADHMVLKTYDNAVFYIRIQEVVYVMPTT